MNQVQTFRAKWIWTGEGLPQRDGVLTTTGGQIVSVIPWKDFRDKSLEIQDCGDCCLLPGFINSHTHLEFSDLEQPIPPGKNFAEWILRVVQHRMLSSFSRGDSVEESAANRQRIGCQEAVEAGTALVLNVVHGSPSEVGHFGKLHQISFAELMSTTDLRRRQTWRSARSMMRDCAKRERVDDHLLLGLSPHAPYTTTGKLVRQTVQRCRRFKLPLMMHLAETREELNWIESGDGPLEEMLEMMVGPMGLPTHDRLTLSGYVNEILKAPKALLIHGNYLDDESKDSLSKRRDTAAVVFCPRTHQHFGHDRYPLEQMLKQGIRVLLGTDSRASNPDLNIWEEARAVARSHLTISPDQIIRMITSDASALLGLEHSLGFLGPNAKAIINAVPCNCSHPEFVLEEILNTDSKPVPLVCF